MIEDNEVKMSPLCQQYSHDGKTIQIYIYEDGEDGWILEVVDEYNNSTVWDDPFATDEGALNEVFKTVKEEGIESLIGVKSSIENGSNTFH